MYASDPKFPTSNAADPGVSRDRGREAISAVMNVSAPVEGAVQPHLLYIQIVMTLVHDSASQGCCVVETVALQVCDDKDEVAVAFDDVLAAVVIAKSVVVDEKV